MPGFRLPLIYTPKKGSFASNLPNTPGNLACKISNPTVRFTTLENASVPDLHICTGNTKTYLQDIPLPFNSLQFCIIAITK